MACAAELIDDAVPIAAALIPDGDHYLGLWLGDSAEAGALRDRLAGLILDEVTRPRPGTVFPSWEAARSPLSGC
jgi:hypothetical protein